MSKKEKAGNPVKEAKLAYQQFLTENNISDIKSIKDAKLKKKHKALLDAIEAAEQARTGGAKKDKKSKTPAAKKGNPQFARKYDYPKDVVTADEKKKYRILQRRLAKNRFLIRIKSFWKQQSGRLCEEIPNCRIPCW